MSRWLHFYTASLDTLRSALPIVGALVAIRPEKTDIATRIPGLGECRSTYCAPVRARAPRTAPVVRFAHAVSGARGERNAAA